MNSKKGMIFFFILIIITSSIWGLKNLSKTFDALIEAKTQVIATNICNDAVNDRISNVNYSDLIDIESDENGKIKLVQVNAAAMNSLLDGISNSLQEKMNNMKEEYVFLPISSILGSDVLSNVGPKLKIKVLPVANFYIDFNSQFVANGINQTIHKIYVVINCEITIITPVKQVTSNADNNILIGEVVIIGDVPNTYYNLEGVEKIEPLDTLNFE